MNRRVKVEVDKLKDSKFRQIIVYDHNGEIEGVLNFRRMDIRSYFTNKSSKNSYLRILNGADRAYLVLYDDLKAIIDD